MTVILTLINETERWRAEHKAASRHIETAACAIRLKALRDAVESGDYGEKPRP